MRTISKPKDFDQEIKAGSSDSVEFFKFDDRIAVLSTNYGLGYAGLDVYEPDKGRWSDNNYALITDTFIQNVDELELNKDFFDYTSINQAKILMNMAY